MKILKTLFSFFVAEDLKKTKVELARYNELLPGQQNQVIHFVSKYNYKNSPSLGRVDTALSISNPNCRYDQYSKSWIINSQSDFNKYIEIIEPLLKKDTHEKNNS